jgi:hypothetical protein
MTHTAPHIHRPERVKDFENRRTTACASSMCISGLLDGIGVGNLCTHCVREKERKKSVIFRKWGSGDDLNLVQLVALPT